MPNHDMRGCLRCRLLNAPVPQFPQVEITKQAFARPKQNRRDGDAELINEAGPQELLDGVGDRRRFAHPCHSLPGVPVRGPNASRR